MSQELTTVHYVGGYWGGKSKVQAEPLPSVTEVKEFPAEYNIAVQAAIKFGDTPPPLIEPVKTHTYILHTIQRGAKYYRAYVHIDHQFGGITDADLAHLK